MTPPELPSRDMAKATAERERYDSISKYNTNHF